ncbi:unnamed protein product [Adineta steineri]|uniref:EGF-like domain-containing protein n=2 Tax=Adineta steineri TaxID=433720 RepID=A0A818WCW3_9BILA|nr:unnamed protein product [Adineta steineri]
MNVVSLCWLLIVVLNIICFTNANWITGNLCWSMPCMNGGSCFGSAYTYICICPINYNGALCEKRLGVCQENPCGNRGLCVETSLTSFECRCYFGYMGSTCEQHVLKNNHNIWSSLSPVHTRILFNMLQEAYHERIKHKSLNSKDTDQIDFIDLLTTTKPAPVISKPKTSTITTTTTTTVETTFITPEIGTTEYIIHAQDIQLEEIFSDITTISSFDMNTTEFTEQYDNSTSFLSYSQTDMSSMAIENMTTPIIEQSEPVFLNTTDDLGNINVTEPSNTLITSTFIELTNYTDTVVTQEINEEITTTFETNPTDSTSDNDTFYSTDQTITLPFNSSLQLTTNNSQTVRGKSLYKLCQQILSRIYSNISLSTDDTSDLTLPSNLSSVHNNTFLSWFRKQFTSSTSTIETTTIPSLAINVIRTSSIPLQRVDMDDVLHQMNNNIDIEH